LLVLVLLHLEMRFLEDDLPLGKESAVETILIFLGQLFKHLLFYEQFTLDSEGA
jgi:hypothetical protein